MAPVTVIEFLPEDLRRFMARTEEARYALIDVRQPAEYAVAHIPGATLWPLPELEERLFDLPADRELVFYCSAGPRSEIAATLTAEAELSNLPVYHLVGGMLAWDGRKLADFPRVQVFDRRRELPAMLMTAMDLEKGAFRYYRTVAERFSSLPLRPTIARLAAAEEAHARMLYELWKPHQANPQPFASLFDALPGDILEGGEPLPEVLARLAGIAPGNGLPVLELSLGIEYQAYDLYRHMAETATDERVRESLLAIAQAEKAHMRLLTEAIADLV